MKPLSKEQLAGLVESVVGTQDQELTCTECQQGISEFAERQLASQPLAEALRRVEEHLAICPECTEELLALKKILEAGK
ncbi:MAG: hypothetical protein WCS70_07470 [Verrucomicrobiota bacterium]